MSSQSSITVDAFFSTYEFVGNIGAGCFGQIYKVNSKKDGKNYSLKKVLIDSGYYNRELSILLKIQNTEGVLNLIDFLLLPIPILNQFLNNKKNQMTELEKMEYESIPKIDKKYENQLYLITKCYTCNLRTLLLEEKLSNFQTKNIVKKISQGISNLHKKGICHRDLKTENILVDLVNEDVCVADLGSAKEFTNETKGGIAYICSRPYRAPELLLGHTDYDLQIDIWSMGCIIFELLTTGKKRLFTGDSGKSVLMEVISYLGPPTKEDLQGLGEKRTISIVSKISNKELDATLDPKSDLELRAYMKECLRWNPQKRADINKWLQSDYFRT